MIFDCEKKIHPINQKQSFPMVITLSFFLYLSLLFSSDYDKSVNDTEGKVSSPRYHGKYPNNADHYITIINQKGSRIVLQFLLFDVHSSDFLEVSIFFFKD